MTLIDKRIGSSTFSNSGKCVDQLQGAQRHSSWQDHTSAEPRVTNRDTRWDKAKYDQNGQTSPPSEYPGPLRLGKGLRRFLGLWRLLPEIPFVPKLRGR
ncbi:hypothetical protein GWK47_048295 [Chionoecetes opilio]|uniref:Uncharacterized protein n=1 Tax=Chionoecetes opilio TaxID=41210 RepID=A0A8J4Y322_CHIOP|nr:hypothetical protein GWK47_048295 [Chionoecetes opilio]